jgi:hypothetical protein
MGPGGAPQDTKRQDPTDGVGTEAAVLQRSPSIDFPEHRPELGVGRVEPVTQRLDRANGPVAVWVDNNRGPLPSPAGLSLA